MRSDVIVLGAGIVGVSTALHLQARGRSVTLLDRRGAGEETSYGNAGLIERSSIIPYAFPREPLTLLRYALNRSLDARFHWAFLPRIAPWLFQYWRHSSPRRLAEAAGAMLPLVERSVTEHAPLLREAGVSDMARPDGWLELYRRPDAWQAAVASAEALKDHGLNYEVLDSAALRAREPHLSDAVAGAVHWKDPVTVSDPGGVTKAYAALFAARGGGIVAGDARSLAADGAGWAVRSAHGRISARAVVVALGPWSSDVFAPLGYRIPLAVKRGYHRHFTARGNAVLNHPVIDMDAGYVLSSMAQGIRLTTGIEFAPRDSAPTPVQIERIEPVARALFPLEERVEAEPWVGNRPCLPDMRPVIGRAPRHPGVWFAFGHAHHGFTLGPITGRLIAELMTGETPSLDPTPYRADRF